MKKSLSITFLILLIVSGLTFVGNVHLASAHGTNVSGPITSDTAWTEANSPYIFIGDVTVKNGVTLSILPGATIDLGDYSLQVNGTLYARGSSEEKITFLPKMNQISSYPITFTSFSSNWNSKTGVGCIIENTDLSNNSIYITDSSPKIDNNTIDFSTNSVQIVVDGGSATVSDNNIIGWISVSNGSPTIANNTVAGVDIEGSPIIANNTFIDHYGSCGITVNGGYPQIINNNLSGEHGYIQIYAGSPTITSNTISNGGYQDQFNNYDVIYIGGVGTSTISNNTIIANNSQYDGIYFPDNNRASISGNTISGCQSAISIGLGSATVEKNYLANNYKGIKIWDNASITIQNNTITQNDVGISLEMPSSTTINRNNLDNNTEYNIQLSPSPLWSKTIDATNNWWGTTDAQAINQTIYDSKNDSTLGTVNFDPFLKTPVSSSSSSPSPSQPTISPVELIVVVMAILISVVAIGAFFLGKRKGQSQTHQAKN